MSLMEYTMISKGGVTFDEPTDSGAYPLNVSTDMITWEHEYAEHKTKQIEYKTYLGVKQAIGLKNAWAVDKEWLESI